MASPFVFVPESSPSDPPSRHHNLYYFTPQSPFPPFLPPGTILPSSPYLGPASLPNTPNTPQLNNHLVLWPESEPQDDPPLIPSWGRQRTTSWHGPAPPTSSRLMQAVPPDFWEAELECRTVPRQRRNHSWGTANAPPPPSWWMNARSYVNPNPPLPLMQIHPWLNGDVSSPAVHFDLASSAFAPMRLIPTLPPHHVLLSATDIRVPAFYPPRTALRILHAQLPFWPVDLKLPPDVPAAPPITLGDVLVALHRTLHQRISHADWATLTVEQEVAVTRAFTHRCRGEAARSEGRACVKLVDFLLGKTVFRGLVRDPRDPEGCVRMITV
ncbi:hypothetical protein C8J57DRAFT_1077756 [Mycena rebaudengoi]|nr:hypothetical protein C8J57DRAFT_1077756 [Mycena rebaudengoi]